MKLPGGEHAYVSPAKLHDYILSRSHLHGRAKARWCRALGFDEANAAWLAQALTAVAVQEEVTEVRSSEHGVLDVIEGDLRGSTGRTGRVRTVWVVEPGDERPKLVTAYPARPRE